jgi:hypothetical protein
MLRATHGHLASKNENKRQKNIWMVVRSHDRGHSGQGGLVLVCWAVCFNTQELVWWLYTHARMHTNCIHATLTQTHAPTHARNTHTYTRSHARNTHTHARNTHMHTRTHACTHQYTTWPTHTLTLKCSTYTCMRTHQALTDTYTIRWFPRTGWSLVAPA